MGLLEPCQCLFELVTLYHKYNLADGEKHNISFFLSVLS